MVHFAEHVGRCIVLLSSSLQLKMLCHFLWSMNYGWQCCVCHKFNVIILDLMHAWAFMLRKWVKKETTVVLSRSAGYEKWSLINLEREEERKEQETWENDRKTGFLIKSSFMILQKLLYSNLARGKVCWKSGPETSLADK